MDRNDVKVIEEYDWSGGWYEWSSAQLGEYEGKYYFRYGNGCSCDDISDEDWQPLRDMTQLRSAIETLSFEPKDLPSKIGFLSTAQGILFRTNPKTGRQEETVEALKAQLDETLGEWVKSQAKVQDLEYEARNVAIFKRDIEMLKEENKEHMAELERLRAQVIDYRGRFALQQEFLAKEGYIQQAPGFWRKKTASEVSGTTEGYITFERWSNVNPLGK